METEKITINNKLSMQQQKIEEIENEKAILKGEQTENAAIKTQQTTETGKILMTIDNMHVMVTKHEIDGKAGEMIITKKEYDESGAEKTTDYDDTGKSCKKAIEQLKIVQQVILNFNDLSRDLE